MAYPADVRETLLNGALEAAVILKRPNRFLERVFTDFKPQYATVGSTVELVVPQVVNANAVDIGSGAVQPANITDNITPITLAHKISSCVQVTTYDQTLAGYRDLASFFIKPRIEEVMRSINGSLGALVTYSNFNTYAPLSGGSDTFTRTNINQAYGILQAAGVPVDDGPDEMSFMVGSTPYANMMSDTNFTNQYIVGTSAAESVQQGAMLVPAVGATIISDPDTPNYSSGEFSGLYMHRTAIGLRTALEPAPPGSAGISSVTIFPRPGFPVTLETWYYPNSQCYYLQAKTVCGYAVTRPEMAQFMISS